MKKICLLSGILLLSVAWFAIGCGIPQEDYDDVLAQLSNVQLELQAGKADLETSLANVSDLTANQEKLNSELTTAQTKLSETGAELEKTERQLESIKAELKTTQHELELAQKELQTFKDDLKAECGPFLGYLALNDALSAVTRSILLNDLEEIPALAATVNANIAPNAVVLKSLWEQAYITEGTSWKLSYAPLTELIKTVDERTQYGANLLRERIR